MFEPNLYYKPGEVGIIHKGNKFRVSAGEYPEKIEYDFKYLPKVDEDSKLSALRDALEAWNLFGERVNEYITAVVVMLGEWTPAKNGDGALITWRNEAITGSVTVAPRYAAGRSVLKFTTRVNTGGAEVHLGYFESRTSSGGVNVGKYPEGMHFIPGRWFLRVMLHFNDAVRAARANQDKRDEVVRRQLLDKMLVGRDV